MKAFLNFFLTASLLFAPALLIADEAGAPELPKVEDGKIDETPKVDPNDKASVETPSEELEAVRAEKIRLTHEGQSRFKLGNFLMGAAGGALLAGAAGFLLFTGSEKDGSIDPNKVATIVPLAAVGGALLGGSLSLF